MLGKGILTKQTFAHWIDTLYATQEHELDCKQFQTYLPAFVEAELNESPLPQTAVLKAHLHQCSDCNEIYQGLRLVMLAEDEMMELLVPGTAELVPIPTD
jgi:predicted anti-sigma-YlaC factor YlaD